MAYIFLQLGVRACVRVYVPHLCLRDSVGGKMGEMEVISSLGQTKLIPPKESWQQKCECSTYPSSHTAQCQLKDTRVPTDLTFTTALLVFSRPAGGFVLGDMMQRGWLAVHHLDQGFSKWGPQHVTRGVPDFNICHKTID